ncbi:MAG: FG-GAP-like repeat-containing protein [Bacteroidota bacterium]
MAVSAFSAVAGTVERNNSAGIFKIENGKAMKPEGPQVAGTFTAVTGTPVSAIASIHRGQGAWADIDNDGDLDLALCGESTTTNTYSLKFYFNNAGTFAAGGSFTGFYGAAIAFGDFDRDGDQDLVVTGATSSAAAAPATAVVYKNNGSGTFTSSGSSGITAVFAASIATGDYDQDGDIDLLMGGMTSGSSSLSTLVLYRNSGTGSFSATTQSAFIGAGYSSVAFGDIDSDGDLDVVAAGRYTVNAVNFYATNVYTNSNGTYTNTNQTLQGVSWAGVALGDYDNDGDLDMFLNGSTDGTQSAATSITKVYKNNGSGTYTELTSSGLPIAQIGTISLADYDTDGDLDVLITGFDGTNRFTRVYTCGATGLFTQFTISGMPNGGSYGYSAWGDYDADGDLDFFGFGNTASGAPAGSSTFYLLNNGGTTPTPTVNTAPTAPTSPSNTVTGPTSNSATLSWTAPTDDFTPSASLSYNIRIGTAAGTNNIAVGNSNTTTGVRRVAARGFLQATTTSVVNLTPGTYYWSVQAVDGGLKGGAWSTEQSFTIGDNGVLLTDLAAGLPALSSSGTAWADYDMDGDQDLLLFGETTTAGTPATYLYKNNGAGVFTDAAAGLIGVYNGSASWGDYDKDGDLDLALMGQVSTTACTTIIYSNTAGVFAPAVSGVASTTGGTVLYNSYFGQLAWGDIDNDGDLDLAVTGLVQFNAENGNYFNTGTLRIYKNTAGAFATYGLTGLIGSGYGSLTFGDADNDGDLDLFVGGYAGNGTAQTTYTNSLYKNDAASFTLGTSFTGTNRGSISVADYDADGDLDVMITGTTSGNAPEAVAKIYTNAGNAVYYDQGQAVMTGAANSTSVWLDYDNDGDLDALVNGLTSANTRKLTVYKNISNNFYAIPANITNLNIQNGNMSIADVNGDGKMEILLTGTNTGAAAGGFTKLLTHSLSSALNTAPSTPGNPTTLPLGGSVKLIWDKSTDAQTASAGLSYTLRLGTTPGGNELSGLVANTTTGYHRVSARGQAQWQSDGYIVLGLPSGTYYWSVQAVDPGFLGSGFTTEGSFTITLMTDANTAIDNLSYSSVSWGDYDNDGDLDLATNGMNTAGTYQTKIFKNTAGVFTDAGFTLTGSGSGSVAWGDYDNDGFIDLLVTGQTGTFTKSTDLYHNNNGTSFTPITTGIVAIYNGRAAWGDYDTDGDLDIAITGLQNFSNTDASYFNSGTVRIYRNDGNGVFVDRGLTFLNVGYSGVTWGDYDNDGDLDLAINGYAGTGSFTYQTLIYRNNAGSFVNSGLSFQGVNWGNLTFGDFDADGDLDLITCGSINGNATSSDVRTRYYRNEGAGTSFTDMGNAGLPNIMYSSVATGDYDNDGDLDLLLSGFDGVSRLARVYTYSSGTFNNAGYTIPGGALGSVAWADYDGDNDLDVLATGNTTVTTGSTTSVPAAAGGITKLFINGTANSNTVPSQPQNTASQVLGGRVKLTWNKSTDTQTSSNGLAYNLRVGTAPGLSNIVSGMASASGTRRIAARGPAQWQAAGDTLGGLATGTYYWKVQAIDGAFAGGPFSTEGSFTVTGFESQTTAVTPVSNSSQDFGDYDKDGDLDLVVAGRTAAGVYQTTIYTNNGSGAYTDAGQALTGVAFGSSVWGDYDNDGDLDLLLMGATSATTCTTMIYVNTAGSFAAAPVTLPGLYSGKAAFADYDLDGDLDIALTGLSQQIGTTFYNSGQSYIYRNDRNNTFTANTSSILQLGYSALTWGDMDNDGDPDLLIGGYSGTTFLYYTRLYVNNAGSFTPSQTTAFQGLNWSNLSFADIDTDGDLDILISGSKNGTQAAAQLYTNVVINIGGGFFTNGGTMGLPNLMESNTSWGDYDNDGDLDLLFSGFDGTGRITRVYTNNGGTSFSNAGYALSGVSLGAAAWADADNDGDLDIVLTGNSTSSVPAGATAGVYLSGGQSANTAPSAPSALSATVIDNSKVSFTFAGGSDAQTPASGLTYSLKVGSVSNTNAYLSAPALNSGMRTLAVTGDRLHKGALPETLVVKPGTYFWSVQTIDQAFKGSAFTQGGSFMMANYAPTADVMPDTEFCTFGGMQTLTLGGISDGNEGTQTLSITATSDNPSVLPAPTFTYVNGSPTVSLTFNPVYGAFGTAHITLRLNDGDATDNILNRVLTIQVKAPAVSKWTGNVSSDWSDPGNWDCIPLLPNNVLIPFSRVKHDPVLKSGQSFTTLDLTVEDTLYMNGTSALTVTGTLANKKVMYINNNNLNVSGNFDNRLYAAVNMPDHDFTVGGNFTNSGWLRNGTNGSVTFNGTALQVLSGTLDVKNLIVSNSGGGVTCAAGAAVTIWNTFSLPSGGKYNGLGSTTLLSNANGTARVGKLTADGQITGSLTTQRHIPRSLTSFTGIGSSVLLGSPFTNTTLADFQTPLNRFFGFPGAPLASPLPGSTSVWFFNPNDNGVNSGWVLPNNITDAMTPGRGAKIFFSGAFMTSPAVYSLTGTPPSSLTHSFPISYCASGCSPGMTTNGWNMVANPVPSEIEWKSSGWTKNDISPAIYIWQQNQKRYSAYIYDPAIGASSEAAINGGSGTLGSGQGFFVEALSAAASLSANEDIKVTGTTPYTGLQRIGAEYVMNINLRSPAGYENNSLLSLRDGATRGFDRGLDARLLSGSVVNVAVISADNKHLAIARSPIPVAEERITLYITSTETGTHKLNFGSLADLTSDGFTVYLKDNYNGVMQDIALEQNYSFTINADPASKGATRFEIVFTPSSVTGIGAKAGAMFDVSPNPGRSEDITLNIGQAKGQNATITVTDMLGRTVQSRRLNLNAGAAAEKLGAGLKAGVYNVTCTTENGTLSRKVVVE